MATATTAGRPTPERLFNALNAFQQRAALRTAIELDVFTAIGAGANTAAVLATKTGASEKGVRILCDYLTIQGFLAKEQGRYALTQESAIFLDRKSPASLASMAGFLSTERSEEHTSELQSPDHLVCRFLLEKKKTDEQPYPLRLEEQNPHDNY